jgi:hypothetical protein
MASLKKKLFALKKCEKVIANKLSRFYKLINAKNTLKNYA